jgi:Protein of unknown function (DUF3237)
VAITHQAPDLNFEMTYTVRTTNPLEPTVGAPFGAKQYWQVSEATLEGSRIKAELAGTGMDWMSVGSDGFWRPDVHTQFITDDGAIILLHYTGLVEQTEGFAAAAEADQPTDWIDQYMRLALHFETGSQRYLWLNSSLFVAKGRLLGTGHIEYEVYRVL